jgi:hypothetical protein
MYEPFDALECDGVIGRDRRAHSSTLTSCGLAPTTNQPIVTAVDVSRRPARYVANGSAEQRHKQQRTATNANICENCANFRTGPEFTDVLTEQLDDIHALKADAAQRGSDGEAARHATTAAALTTHLRQLRR